MNDIVGKHVKDVAPDFMDSDIYSECINAIRTKCSSVIKTVLRDRSYTVKIFQIYGGLGLSLSPDFGEDNNSSSNDGDPLLTSYSKQLTELSEIAINLGHRLGTLVAAHDMIKSYGELDRSDLYKNNLDTGTFAGYVQRVSKSISHAMGIISARDYHDTYMKMAKTLAAMTEIREPYARGHSERVSQLAQEMASWLGLSSQETEDIIVAAVLHDIGKIVIPDYILFKSGALTTAEYNEVKRHPAAAADLLRSFDYFSDVLPIIEGHHEWYNGMGYPRKLSDNDIPVGSRIIAVADAYDAMTSPRPHRSRLSSDDALKIIVDGSGKQWDPMIVYAFMEIIGADESLRKCDKQDSEIVEESMSKRKEVGPVVEGKIIDDDQRKSVTDNSKGKRDTLLDKAQEALERAAHWEAWMESAKQHEESSCQEEDVPQ